MNEIIAIGDINIDIVAPVDHYPPPGGHAFAETLVLESGGSAANTAIMLGHLKQLVRMLGRVGDDPLAERALHALTAAGVDISHVQHDPTLATGLVFIAVTPDGERTILGGRGANRNFAPADIDPTTIRTAAWLHLSGYPLAVPQSQAALQKAAQIAQEAGIPISLDVGSGHPRLRWRQAVLDLCPAIQVLLPNEFEARELTDAGNPATAAARLQAAGAAIVAIKLAERGCLIHTASTTWQVPAFEIEPANTIAAGDAFNAGFVVGQLAGWDLRTTGLLANALGALAAAAPGASSGLPDLAALRRFLNARRKRSRWRGWATEFEQILDWLQQVESGKEKMEKRRKGWDGGRSRHGNGHGNSN